MMTRMEALSRSRLPSIPAPAGVALSLSLFLIAALVDHFGGLDVRAILFYAASVIAASWRFGRAGVLTSVAVSTGSWLMFEVQGGRVLVSQWIWAWNTFVILGTLGLVGSLSAMLGYYIRILQTMAFEDPLTGLLNRRAMMEELERELSRSQRANHPLVIAAIDLDGFKRANDTHGHARGDEVLVEVRRVCAEVLRRSDRAGRMGGDEFLILLPEESAEGARTALERLSATFREAMTSQSLDVTMSIGFVSLRDEYPSVETILHNTDTQLYRAKAEGRNRVCSPG